MRSRKVSAKTVLDGAHDGCFVLEQYQVVAVNDLIAAAVTQNLLRYPRERRPAMSAASSAG